MYQTKRKTLFKPQCQPMIKEPVRRQIDTPVPKRRRRQMGTSDGMSRRESSDACDPRSLRTHANLLWMVLVLMVGETYPIASHAFVLQEACSHSRQGHVNNIAMTTIITATPRESFANKNGIFPIPRKQQRSQPTVRLFTLPSLSIDDAGDKPSSLGKNEKNTTIAVPQNSRFNFRWTSKSMALALPALIGMLADPLLSLMDTACVGQLGKPGDLAALGACTSLFHLAFNAFRATTSATTSLVAGTPPSNSKRRQEIVQVSLQLGIGLGLGVSFLLRVGGPFFLRCMGVPMDSPLFAPSRSYLYTRLWAAPAVLAATVAEGAFRGYGDTKIPLMASLVAAGVNAILDPVLMLPPLKMGVKGAAAATAISQFGALGIYFSWLRKRKMLPQGWLGNEHGNTSSIDISRNEQTTPQKGIVSTILGANLALVGKQGSLLLAWAFATSKATRIGQAHVAAHQVGLSVWLVMALIQDGAGVAAQVLLANALSNKKSVKDENKTKSISGDVDNGDHHPTRYQTARSLVAYMIRFSILQGLVATGILLLAAPILPGCFVPSSSKEIQTQLIRLLPHVAWQQLLVGPTLIAEALAAGGGKFGWLAFGTAVSTALSMWQLSTADTVAKIWSQGIVSLFVGRLITGLIGTAMVLRETKKAISKALQ